jgi:uncharacterized protein
VTAAENGTSLSADFPCGVAPFALNGAAGRIEALATCPARERKPGACVAICHPHPLHGGTMHNKVVQTLARGFGDLGLRTLRFNFRGVGASAGAHDQAIGETDDTVVMLEWLGAQRPQDELWLAGFSFGAYVAMRAAARFPVARVVAVAPAVHLYDFASIPAPRVPWLVIQGDDDEIVPAGEVHKWAEGLGPLVRVVRMEGTGHLFHGMLNELKGIIVREMGK